MQTEIIPERGRILSSLILVALIFIIPSMVRSQMQDSMPIGPRFHYETGFDSNGAHGEILDWGKTLPLYKVYEGAPKIKLAGLSAESIPLNKAIMQRKSIRSFLKKSLDLEQIAQLLQAGDGITHYYKTYALRAAPSGGALFPIDMYVAATGVDSLADGLYHFQISDSTLELVKAGNFKDQLFKASFEQGCVEGASVSIILTARFPRSTKKYADRGFRYTYMEAGAISENIYLEATSLGLGTVSAGAFNDDALNALLEIDGREEAALIIMPVGYPAE